MTTARHAIFESIQRSLHRGPLPASAKLELAQRMAQPRAHVIPARGRGSHSEVVERFAAMVVETQASLDRVSTMADAVQAVSRFMTQAGLPTQAVVSPELESLDWREGGVDARFDTAQPGDLTSVTPCHRGVAETGTIIAVSDRDRPSALNFLPDNHVVLVAASCVVGSYEEAWAVLRDEGPLPRTVNWITGPSRTADIEQSLLLGAHGPRRLHVILVDDA